MYEEQENSASFTNFARNRLYDTVDHVLFHSQDAELIYNTLREQLHPIPFGDYLKRHILQTGLDGSFSETPLKAYQDYIIDRFRCNGTPPSFIPTTAKISALAKNWLTQQTVKRSVVLLLGFGLGMSLDQVNTLLERGLHEPSLSYQEPQEAICAFCYSQGLPFSKYEQLWELYARMKESRLLKDNMPDIPEGTVPAQLRTEEELMRYLASQLSTDGKTISQRRAFRQFMKMYDMARDCIARDRSNADAFENSIEVRSARDRLSRTDRLNDYEKWDQLSRMRAQRKTYSREDITEADLEQVLCASIPKDQHGNLVPEKKSLLNQQFAGKRFSRKHLWCLIHGTEAVDRFDLITLLFFLYAEEVDQIPNAQKRYSAYIEKANRILSHCGMGPLYVANPYECFILMCVLSEDPLGTYADVWEMSYETKDGES